MIFGKKKAKQQEEEKKQQEQVKEAEPEVKEIPVSVFSGRVAGVFGKMYRFIFSVNLSANVAQIESGNRIVQGKELPVRLYYNDLVRIISGLVAPAQRDRFIIDFSRENLLKVLAKPGGVQTSYYTFRISGPKNPAGSSDTDFEDVVSGEQKSDLYDENETDIEFLCAEVRAELIPSADESRDKCMIFVRKLSEIPPEFVHQEKSETAEIVDADNDWEDARLRMLVGGDTPVFFEYNSETDTVYMHLQSGDTSVLTNYIKTLESRSDWNIFHGDLKTAKKAILDAVNGKPSEHTIRYRSDNSKNKSFRFHKMQVKAYGDDFPATWVLGSLSDVDNELRDRNSRNAIAEQIENLMINQNMLIFEIDAAKDLMYKIKRDEDGFCRSGQGTPFRAYIQSCLTSGVIEEGSKANYEKWLKPDYLEKMTMNSNFEFEAMLKLPGSLEYRCYRESISKLNGLNHYLVIRRDVNDVYEMRRNEFELEEKSRYAEYNQGMLEVMASLVEFRNVEAGPHISKVRKLTKILLTDMAKRSPNYGITPSMIALYEEAATMHDIGKITIPDNILNKEGPLTPEERVVMQSHTTGGAKIIEGLKLPGQEELLQVCKDVALHHHERFNGKGYPDGLAGDSVSVGVQCVSLADVFDAMVSKRCYKDSIPMDIVTGEIIANENGQFNPRLIESFKACKEEMAALYNE